MSDSRGTDTCRFGVKLGVMPRQSNAAVQQTQKRENGAHILSILTVRGNSVSARIVLQESRHGWLDKLRESPMIGETLFGTSQRKENVQAHAQSPPQPSVPQTAISHRRTNIE